MLAVVGATTHVDGGGLGEPAAERGAAIDVEHIVDSGGDIELATVCAGIDAVGVFQSVLYQREKVPPDSDRCGDCGAKIGNTHHVNCDMESCPKCGLQIISCDCERLRYIRVGYDLNNDLKNLDVGDVVLVFDDPITKKKPEGEAVVTMIKKQYDVWEGKLVKYCEVVFVNDWNEKGVTGEMYPRTILTNIKFEGGE